VGKSSVINSLCRTRAVKVGGTPGVTRAAQEVHLDKHVKLLDSPGIVFPKTTDVDDDIVLRHCVQIEREPDPISPVEAILRRVKKQLLIQVYNIPDFVDVNEFLKHIAKKQGKVVKVGVPDLKSAARKVLQDWVSGKVPFYTEAPQVDPSIHVGAEIVSGFSEKFDFSQSDILNTLTPKQLHRGQALQGGNSNGTETEPIFLHEFPEATKTTTTTTTTSSSVAEDDDDMVEPDYLSDLSDDDEDGDVANDTMSDVSHKTTTTTTSTSSSKKAIVSSKQDLSDETDKYNPQINKNLRKQQKNALKKKNKQAKKVAPSRNDTDAYNFATDFGGDDDDIELAEIDA